LIKMKKVALYFKQASKGQSFVELAVVALVLMALLIGMIEFGFLLNDYIGLVDGAREGARFGSNDDPFNYANPGYTQLCGTFEECVTKVVEGDKTANPPTKGALAPLELDPATDDVVITYYSILAGSPPSALRFPTQGSHNYWCRYCWEQADHDAHPSKFTTQDILDNLDSRAPSTGVLVVEVFYAYHQVLALPVFTWFVPDPINVHTYAIMPLSAAEPTPTP
jgi:hypothetical protein